MAAGVVVGMITAVVMMEQTEVGHDQHSCFPSTVINAINIEVLVDILTIVTPPNVPQKVTYFTYRGVLQK